jgi:hypothetical protein
MTKYDERWRAIERAQWRAQLWARLGAERYGLLRPFWGLDESTLSTIPVLDNWTAKDLLAHVAYWDRFRTDEMSKVADGRLAELQNLTSDDMTPINAQVHQQFKEIPLENVIAILLKERGGFYALLERLSDVELHRRFTTPWGQRTQLRTWARWRWLHDESHAKHLAEWRQELPDDVKKKRLGPKYLLRALLLTSRKEFQLSALTLVPEDERTTLPVCGTWTLKDLLGHITDWEKVGIDGLRQLAAGQTPEFEYTIALNFDEFNNANAAARRGQSWDEVWADYKETRQTLLHLFDQVPEEMMTREFMAPWQRPSNPYFWMTIWFGHEHEHVQDVRQAVGLKLPKRLQH